MVSSATQKNPILCLQSESVETFENFRPMCSRFFRNGFEDNSRQEAAKNNQRKKKRKKDKSKRSSKSKKTRLSCTTDNPPLSSITTASSRQSEDNESHSVRTTSIEQYRVDQPLPGGMSKLFDSELAERYEEWAKLPKAKKDECLPTKAEMTKLETTIAEVVLHKIFPFIKFAPNAEQREYLCAQLIKNLGWPFFERKDEKEKAQFEVVLKCYVPFVMKEINTHRNNVCQSLRGAAMTWMDRNKTEVLPTVEDIIKCATRQSDVPEDLFMWYWNNYMGSAVLPAKRWNINVRYHQTISEKGSIYAGEEAFAVLAFINYRERWMATKVLRNANPELKVKIMEKKKPGARERPGFVYGYISETPAFKPRYTDSDVGAVMDAGWKTEGIKRFVSLRTQIKNARKTDNAKKFEKDFLVKVRAKFNVTSGPKPDNPPPKRFKNDNKMEDLSALNDSDAD